MTEVFDGVYMTEKPYESPIKPLDVNEDTLRIEANRILNDRQYEKKYGYSMWELMEEGNGKD